MNKCSFAAAVALQPLRAVSALLLPACLAFGNPAGAQTSQRYSIQASGLGAQLFGDAYTGFSFGTGAEVQLRYNHSALSYGVGVQQTSHALAGVGDVTLGGFFVEPRYVLSIIKRDNVAMYTSARVALLRQHLAVQDASAWGLTLNAGGGLLLRLSRRLNGEAGVTFGYTRFGDYVNPTTGFRSPTGSGSNIVLRLGLAAGLFR